jgi:hypothetical protein
MIFAREITGPLTSLVKQIDEINAKSPKMGSFVVFLNDDEGLSKKLKELADKEKLSTLRLAIDNPAGPKNYKVAKDADVTVVLYNKGQVQANHAFRKGDLNAQAVEKVIVDVKKLAP